MNENEDCIMDLLNRYHLYLYSLGYKINSINDNHCTITDYINSIKTISKIENKTVENLASEIEEIFQEYKEGGKKHNKLPQNNNRTLKGLEHFKEFISLCNKK